MTDLHTLVQRAPEYELGALLRALFTHGFDWSDVRFEGVRDLHAERGELVRGLYLEEQPARRAIVQLNTGLLARSSPLPDYFRDFARRLHDPDAFINFLGFWDSVQLRALAYASFPRLSVGKSRALGHGYRARLFLASPMSLHWLFRSIFPELRVEVHAALFRRSTASGRARVGSTLDGRLVIGAEFTDRRPGFRVRLYAEDAACEGVLDWEGEALRRLARLEPVLARLQRPIEVALRFEEYRHGHTLVDHASARRQLGVRPWLRPSRDEQVGPGDVVVRSAFP